MINKASEEAAQIAMVFEATAEGLKKVTEQLGGDGTAAYDFVSPVLRSLENSQRRELR